MEGREQILWEEILMSKKVNHTRTNIENCHILLIPDNLRIIHYLQGGPLDLDTIAEKLGVTKAGAFYHTKVLLELGFISRDRKGGKTFYYTTWIHGFKIKMTADRLEMTINGENELSTHIY